jgi:hypothetical protein
MQSAAFSDLLHNEIQPQALLAFGEDRDFADAYRCPAGE